jgi:hypothetical protein
MMLLIVEILVCSRCSPVVCLLTRDQIPLLIVGEEKLEDVVAR